MLNKVATIHESLSNSSVDIEPLEINPLSITGAVQLQAEQAGLQEYLSGQLSLPCVQPRISREQINTISRNKAGSVPSLCPSPAQGGSQRAPIPFIPPGWPTAALRPFLHFFHLKIISGSCPYCTVWKIIPGYSSIMVWGFFSAFQCKFIHGHFDIIGALSSNLNILFCCCYLLTQCVLKSHFVDSKTLIFLGYNSLVFFWSHCSLRAAPSALGFSSFRFSSLGEVALEL